MKKIFLIISLSYATLCSAQTNCNPTVTPIHVYPPNSTTTPTNISGYEYLCGQNTIVVDTFAIGCNQIYINSSCTVTLKVGGCPTYARIWIKNNSTLNILSGSNFTYIIKEPLAIINNPSNAPNTTSICPSISFPTVNCVAAGIISFENERKKINIYPNPANEILNIELEFLNVQSTMFNYQLSIINTLGQLITEKEILLIDNKALINIKELQNGVYVLKLIDISRSDKLQTVSKRFVVNK